MGVKLSYRQIGLPYFAYKGQKPWLHLQDVRLQCLASLRTITYLSFNQSDFETLFWWKQLTVIHTFKLNHWFKINVTTVGGYEWQQQQIEKFQIT